VKVELSRRAQRAIARIDTYWREHADHPDVFYREILDAVEYLETVSSPGTPCPTPKRPKLKRVLLEKSRCHIYFELEPASEVVRVLTVWDGRRERGPRL
jgi:plasmid stabilization system protein ParE